MKGVRATHILLLLLFAWLADGRKCALAKPIERVTAGMRVLSRDPATGRQGYKPVVETFVTRPETLCHLRFATPDGTTTQTLTCTGEHPFWVVENGGFVPAAEMSPGQTVSLSGGGTLILTSKTTEHAPPGETFTTYNFEVALWHTYFAGQRGVWAHNHGATCQHIFSAFDRLKLLPTAPGFPIEVTLRTCLVKKP